ncbi:MAG TPA: hypothetical protein VF789_31740 [Thermoanaerobaculia bacterium]
MMPTHAARRWCSSGLAVLFLLAAGPAPARATDAREVIGVAHAAGRYNFTDEDYLNEGAGVLLELGTRVVKIFFLPNQITTMYPFNSDWGDPPPASLVELAQRPYFQELFKKPFSTYILVTSAVNGGTPYFEGLTREEAEAEREQMYALTKYLLTTYAKSGKTFILQNWEGDHLLRQHLAEGADPDPKRVEAMIQWFNVRQDGVRAARKELGDDLGVEVLHAIEVNHLARAMAGKVSMTNSIVPFTRSDLYSYSSWDVEFDPPTLVKALDYLEAKAPDNRRYGSRNIYLGEFGVAKDHGVPEGDRPERIRDLLEAALGWGVRYVVYWEVFCNEAMRDYTGRPRNKDLRGFWLIRPDGEKTPMWDLLDGQLDAGFHRAAFSSFSNQYLSVDERNRGVTAERWTRGGRWETFMLKDWNGGGLQNGDEVSLQSHDGRYLTVERGSAGRVFAREATPGRLERFTLHKIGGAGAIAPGDSVAFETRSGLFLGAEVGGRGTLRAVRPVPGPAEVFRFVDPEE